MVRKLLELFMKKKCKGPQYKAVQVKKEKGDILILNGNDNSFNSSIDTS